MTLQFFCPRCHSEMNPNEEYVVTQIIYDPGGGLSSVRGPHKSLCPKCVKEAEEAGVLGEKPLERWVNYAVVRRCCARCGKPLDYWYRLTKNNQPIVKDRDLCRSCYLFARDSGFVYGVGFGDPIEAPRWLKKIVTIFQRKGST